jgi:hypothetical protein
MLIRRIAFLVLAAPVWLVPCGLARADSELTFVPYAEVGLVDYSLAFDGTVPVPGGGEEVFQVVNDFNFSFSLLKIGLAAAWGDFYANLYYRATTEDSDVQVTEGAQSIKWNGDREETSLAIGYDITDQINVFGGYRDSETSGSGTGDSAYSFSHDGYFFGASYYLSLTDSGGLTFSAGYAWLDAVLDETVLGLTFPASDGDGSGLKVGASWRDLFNTHWGYSVSVEYFDYNYDLDGDGGITFEMEERETVISLGLFYLL